MKTALVASVATGSLFGFISSASAEVFDVEFSGSLLSAYGSFLVGEPVTGSLEYDSSSTPWYQFPSSSQFPDNYDIKVNIGGTKYTYDINYISYGKYSPTADAIQFLATDFNSTLTILGLPFASALNLPLGPTLEQGTALFSFAAPGFVGIGSGSASFSVAAVPEPSTWVMMALGFAGLGLAGYLKTKRGDGAAFSAA